MNRHDGWWYISTGATTGLVEVKDEQIVTAPPIWRNFEGRPARHLGAFYRGLGVTFKVKRIIVTTHVYAWGNNAKRQMLKGRPCRIVARGTMRSVLVEFNDGQREVVSIRALRKEKD